MRLFPCSETLKDGQIVNFFFGILGLNLVLNLRVVQSNLILIISNELSSIVPTNECKHYFGLIAMKTIDTLIH